MFYLLYYAYESKPFSETDLEELLAKARSNNAQYNITGKLLFVEGTFIQILEGEEKIVKEVYSKIEEDKRIIYVHKVAEGEIKNRYFPDWTMAFKSITLTEINHLENCNHPEVKAYLESATPIRLLRLMAPDRPIEF